MVDVRFRSAPTSDAQSRSTPVIGAGTIEVGRDGLRVQGRRARRALAMTAAILVGLVGITAAAIGLVALGVEPDGRGIRKIAFLVGMAFGIAPAVWVYGLVRDHVRGRAVDAVVPWSAVAIVVRAPGRTTVRLSAPELRGDVVIEAAGPAAADELARVPPAP
ncbi:MAG: hypothetical protein KF773_31505 [Deltaproteobacteria bacterium]|nr:hypothetical protein [Deltaproteobacteria bacterium]